MTQNWIRFQCVLMVQIKQLNWTRDGQLGSSNLIGMDWYSNTPDEISSIELASKRKWLRRHGHLMFIPLFREKVPHVFLIKGHLQGWNWRREEQDYIPDHGAESCLHVETVGIERIVAQKWGDWIRTFSKIYLVLILKLEMPNLRIWFLTTRAHQQRVLKRVTTLTCSFCLEINTLTRKEQPRQENTLAYKVLFKEHAIKNKNKHKGIKLLESNAKDTRQPDFFRGIEELTLPPSPCWSTHKGLSSLASQRRKSSLRMVLLHLRNGELHTVYKLHV